MIDRYSGITEETERPQGKLTEHLAFLEDDSNDFREIPSTRRNSWEGFPKAVEASASLQSQADSSQGGLNIVFWFWQPSSNSAKPLWPALCGFTLNPKVGNIPCNGPNSTMSYLHTGP